MRRSHPLLTSLASLVIVLTASQLYAQCPAGGGTGGTGAVAGLAAPSGAAGGGGAGVAGVSGFNPLAAIQLVQQAQQMARMQQMMLNRQRQLQPLNLPASGPRNAARGTTAVAVGSVAKSSAKAQSATADKPKLTRREQLIERLKARQAERARKRAERATR